MNELEGEYQNTKKNNKIKIYNYFGLFEYKCVAS